MEIAGFIGVFGAPNQAFLLPGHGQMPSTGVIGTPQSELLYSLCLWSIDTKYEQDASAPPLLALCLRQAIVADYLSQARVLAIDITLVFS